MRWMFSYPPLRLGVLQGMMLLKTHFDTNPDALQAKDCPYDIETIEVLQQLFAPKIVEKTVEVPVKTAAAIERRGRGRPAREKGLSGEQADELEQTAKDLLKELNSLGKKDEGRQVILDTTEQIQIIKAKTSLVEQILKIQERVQNVKRIAEFQATVISILDDLVSEDDRTAFLTRLEAFLD